MSAQSTYAGIEIRDAIMKLGVYFKHLVSKQLPHEKSQKIVKLSYQTFMKFSDNEEFTREVYEKTKSLILTKQNYYLLYLMDQMLKNNKMVIRYVKKQLDNMFKLVWEKVWLQFDNQDKLENLKIMARIWGIIYGQKCEQSIKKWLESKYNMKLNSISPQHEAQIREVYEVSIKKDPQYEQLIGIIDENANQNNPPQLSLEEVLGLDM